MPNKSDKELFEYLESHRGRQLTKQEKKNAIRLYKNFDKYDRRLKRTSNILSNKAKRFSFFRYLGTAAASIALCLSIALPITIYAFDKPPLTIYLPNPDDKGKDNVINPRYQNDTVINTDYIHMKNLGFLLFSDKEFEEQIFVDTETILVEYTTKMAGMPLSYVIEGAMVIIEDETVTDTFVMDYRIRTYQEYDFTTYYTDFYATLEMIYNDKTAKIADENELYMFDNFKVIESQDTKRQNENYEIINAFMIETVVVFCYACPFSEMASIYFIYGSNEYMITLSKDINADPEFQTTPTAEYIQKHFMPALFKNSPD